MANTDDNDNAEDQALFRRVMKEAQPLDSDQRAPDYKPRPVARARFTRDDDHQALLESLEADVDDIDQFETGAGDSLRFHHPSVGRRTMRKLARGNISVQDEIDLHGLTVSEAKDTLRQFIGDATDRGHTCVRIVHGKGLGSGHRGPVLKGKVNNWLRRWDDVLAFVSTRQAHGGTGAVYVLLKK